jgi:hypothetical protein
VTDTRAVPMFPKCRQVDTKKPAVLWGCGLLGEERG